jgi:ribose 5-phosphate isomerase A
VIPLERRGEAMARRAAELVRDGDAVGLGTGRAAGAFVRALAERARRGLRVRCVPTSRATEAAARALGLSLVELEEAGQLDLAVDGADEVGPGLDLVKGYGGALVRERIVAEASRRLVILAEPEKLVPALGARGRLPVEVVPFGWSLCAARIAALGLDPRRRVEGGAPFVTDNGNQLLDCAVRPIADPAGLELQLRAIPGVVGTGLFLGLADAVFLEDADGDVTLRERG